MSTNWGALGDVTHFFIKKSKKVLKIVSPKITIIVEKKAAIRKKTK